MPNVACFCRMRILHAAHAVLSHTCHMPSVDDITACVWPWQYILVSVKTDVPVMFAGTEEPAAYGDLHSIGAIGGEKNKAVSSTFVPVIDLSERRIMHASTLLCLHVAGQISKLIMDVVEAKFKVPSDRFYLTVRLLQAPMKPLF